MISFVAIHNYNYANIIFKFDGSLQNYLTEHLNPNFVGLYISTKRAVQFKMRTENILTFRRIKRNMFKL